HRLLADVVDLERDSVVNAAGLDLDPAATAVEHERHGDDGLQRVALRAAGRGDVGVAAADPDGKVEHTLHGLCRKPRPVVRHRDAGLIDGDGDLGCDAGLLTGIERVVEQLLQDHERPLRRAMPGLCDQLLLVAEVEQARRSERLALQARLALGHGGGGGHVADSSSPSFAFSQAEGTRCGRRGGLVVMGLRAAAAEVPPRDRFSILPVCGHSGSTAFSFSSLRISSTEASPMWGSIVTPTSVRCEMCQGVTCDPTPFVLYSHRKFLEGGMARKTTDSVQLKLRFSEALRRRLEREARRQEHSLNGEIINRLEQSFRKSEDADLLGSTLRALFGGATGDLLRAIATVIWLIERRTGKKWN